MPLAASQNSTTDHGGTPLTWSSKLKVSGLWVLRVGDTISCPLPGHGVTTIDTGSTKLEDSNGQKVAWVGSQTSCGAVITTGLAKLNIRS